MNVFGVCSQSVFSQMSKTITNSTSVPACSELTRAAPIKITCKFVGAELGIHGLNGDTTVAECG